MQKKLLEKLESLPLSLSLKFLIGIFGILIFFSGFLSLLFYFYLKEKMINSYYEKMHILFTQLEATGKYIQRDLRPLMLKLLQSGFIQRNIVKEELIFYALSTTKVRKIILRYFNEQFPKIKYERVSLHPINPENKMNNFHKYLLAKLYKKRNNSDIWRGILSFENEEYLVLVRPIYVESSCLLCHGRLTKMPYFLISVYHPTSDFPWKEGDLMGLELLTYPVKEVFTEIKNSVISLFTLSLIAGILLLLTLEGVFYVLILSPLKILKSHFLAIKKGEIPLQSPLLIKRKDEIGDLYHSFNELAYHLFVSQKSLNENLKTLETLFEGITQPIALFNQNCNPELANQAFLNFPYKECYETYLSKVFKDKRVYQEVITPEEGKYYLLTLYPIFDEKGEVIKAVQILEDITEQKKMEEQLILTEKLAAIGHLSAGLAHEINNPLSGMLLMLKNLQKNNLTDEERKFYLNLLESGLFRIQRIIKDLLNFSRSTEIKREKASINNILEEVLELSSYLLKKENIKIIKDLDPHLPEIFVDKEKMEQVFLNLLLNAIQAMENTLEKVLTLKTYQKNERVYISIQDSGPGIPEEFVSKIFDPFFTTKPPGKGTGLGLTVSLAIVKNHGGTIHLEKYKEGAIFTIELPLELKEKSS